MTSKPSLILRLRIFKKVSQVNDGIFLTGCEHLNLVNILRE
jgi:hypothetical protein